MDIYLWKNSISVHTFLHFYYIIATWIDVIITYFHKEIASPFMKKLEKLIQVSSSDSTDLWTQTQTHILCLKTAPIQDIY